MQSTVATADKMRQRINTPKERKKESIIASPSNFPSLSFILIFFSYFSCLSLTFSSFSFAPTYHLQLFSVLFSYLFLRPHHLNPLFVHFFNPSSFPFLTHFFNKFSCSFLIGSFFLSFLVIFMPFINFYLVYFSSPSSF